jgi:ribA/ribD-fused uncharacterized protein
MDGTRYFLGGQMISSSQIRSHPLLNRVPAEKLRIYPVGGVCAFWTTRVEHGEFSNMASGFPLQVGAHRFGSSEALYQAFRFTEFPDIQRTIYEAISPRMAKQRAYDYLPLTRDDWKLIRRDVMRWVIHVKAAQHKKEFTFSLLQTGDVPVVEESTKDVYWGAVRIGDSLIGMNVLGRLLMELRSKVRDGSLDLMKVPAPKIEDFCLFGSPVPDVTPTRL